MPNDLENMLLNQVHVNLTHALDSAVQAGDIQAARRATQQLTEFTIKNAKPAEQTFGDADIRASLKAKAPWFGVDPRRGARAVEFGKNMDPKSFKSAEDFADAVIAAVDEEFETEEKNDEPEDDDEKEEKKTARKRTDAPSGNMARAVPRKSSGPWAKLSDAPKDIAETIRSAADKFTRNATKEQREKYIATALGTAYAADQRAKGRK